MQAALPIVVVAVTVVGAIIAVFTLAGSGRAYREIGGGGMSSGEPVAGSAPAVAPADERDEEIRQMLAARNARRERRGEAALDIDIELAALSGQAALTTGPLDADLRDEVRALVVARNRRLERKGQPPLDVEAEVERRLRELT